MSDEPRVGWIDVASARPLCDIPWLGTVTVHASGDVSYCCNSPAFVGNVKQSSFHDIWTGPKLQGIRASLARGELPPECRSNSCPVVRGDRDWYVLQRMRGPHTGNAEQLTRIREGLRGTCWSLAPSASSKGGPACGVLELAYDGPSCRSELVIGIRAGSGAWRFLPDLDPFAVPCAATLELATGPRQTIPLFTLPADLPPGPHEVCVALFASGANLNLIDNAYWAEPRAVVVP